MTEPKLLLARLQYVRRNRDGWTARCPAHDDRNPSLSIIVRDRKILLHCHAGCTTEAICAALGIEMRELFLNSGKDTSHVVAEYPYTDQDETLLYVVERREPKDFRARRPDGKGGWIWNLEGVRRVLYRLTEVLAAKFVLIAEGEKDVETARSLGLVATCNPSGAGKWREEYSEALRGKGVAIITDADESGRKHARQIAASLHGKVESLKALELPGSKDLSDWVENGGTRAALEGYIEECVPEWTPPSDQSLIGAKIRRLEDVPDIFGLPDRPVTWVVEGFLPEGAVTTIAGEPGGCKSSFGLSLAAAVARGGDFIGRKCKQRDVLYLDRENPLAVVKQRLKMIGLQICPRLRIWGRWCEESPPRIGDFRLLEMAREHRPLIIFDSLIRFHAAEENSATEMARVAEGLRMLVDAGATVLVLHHRGRDETRKYRGSSDIVGGPDVVYSASRDKAANLLRLSCIKTRFIEEPDITLRLGNFGSLEFSPTDAPQVSEDRADSQVLRQVIETEPGLPKGKVIERSRLPEHRAAMLLKQGERILWRSEPGARKALLYFTLPNEGERPI